ncbi:unnamed protein product [Cuscuta epithymum]|uniref:Uncharacterized protein n=1 Tax=Cuscuta epithymum TaxID=186058 RepID=A0AAV0BZ27_9ASTE|nr:unnamed protein product [Cuscuta epithymum]
MFSPHLASSFPTLHSRMEDQCSPLSWPLFFQEEEIELKHSLLYTTLELENTILSAQEEISRKDEEILQLKNLLAIFAQERDEAMEECRRLGFGKSRLQIGKPDNAFSGTTTNEDLENGLCNSSDSEEIAAVAAVVSPVRSPPPLPDDVTVKIAPKLPLPEKGKFLQAVMDAGPLLQTLLLAGPLPRWQHPPPQLNSVDIPPVTICSPRLDSAAVSRKRAASNPVSPSSLKYTKVFHQSSSLTSI